jgi:hypothetical protein
MLRPARYSTLFHAFLLLLAVPVVTHAQTATRSTTVAPGASSTDGLFLHVRAGGHGIAFEDGGSRLPGLETDETSGLVYAELGGRFHFRPGHRLVPYADAAIAVIGAGSEARTYGGDVGYGGAGLSVGGGALYFLSPTVALEGGASFTPGSLMESDLGGVNEDIDIGVAGVRMHVGLTFYPFR